MEATKWVVEKFSDKKYLVVGGINRSRIGSQGSLETYTSRCVATEHMFRNKLLKMGITNKSQVSFVRLLLGAYNMYCRAGHSETKIAGDGRGRS